MIADVVAAIIEGVERFELIDEHGRAYIIRTGADVRLSLQDDGKTLKVFVRGKS